MFNPTRLSFARRRRGLSKRALAKLAGVTPQSVTNYELGIRQPEDPGTLARVLDFPPGFFFSDDLDEMDPTGVSFRALSRVTARQRDMAMTAGALALRLSAWIDDRFALPQADLPDFKGSDDPEGAATEMRARWALGDRPIGNMIHLLEAHGVRVFTLAEDCLEVDAFSCWANEIPFVFLNTRKSSERSRFDAAHELAHLTLHQTGSPTGRQAEDQANAFASAFLMPSSGVRATAPQYPTLRSILAGKKLWRVSAVAYAYRLFRLHMLTDWHYHQLMRKMSSLGYRTKEPDSLPRESSQVHRKVFEKLRAEKKSRNDVADELQIHPQELDKLLVGLTLTAVAGSGRPTPGKGRQKHGFTVVKG